MTDLSKSAKAAAIFVFTSGVEDVDTALKLYNQLEEDNTPVKNTLDKFSGVTRWSVVSELSDGSWWEEIQMLAQNIDNFRKHFKEES